MNEFLEYLSAALPHKIKVQIPVEGKNVIGELKEVTDGGGFVVDIDGVTYSEISLNIKPCLRSISDMTEEEADEYENLKADINNKLRSWKCFRLINWLLEHHFDFLNFIPQGLAIEATNEYE